jgi:hypothetical protein
MIGSRLRGAPVDAGRAAHRHAAGLEHIQRRRDLGHRLRGIGAVEHDEIGRRADGNAVIHDAEDARCAAGDHLVAKRQLAALPELRDVRIEVRDAHERAVAVRRERVQHVVRGQRCIHAGADETMRGRDAARHVVIDAAAHQEQIGRRQDRYRYAGIREHRRHGIEARRRQ